jgi:hypothetical protein
MIIGPASMNMWEQTYDADSDPTVCIKRDTRFNTKTEHKQDHHERRWGLSLSSELKIILTTDKIEARYV